MTGQQKHLLSVIAQVRWSSLIIGLMAVAITISNWSWLKVADAGTRYTNLTAGGGFCIVGIGLFLAAGYVGRRYRRHIASESTKIR